MYSSGLRISELIKLKLIDLNIDNSILSVIGKGNKQRVVPVGEKAIIYLMSYIENYRTAFIKKKKRVCYGGTAINNILPLEDQFYNKKIEFPDYDFFSDQALKDAKKLANIYLEQGFEEVTASAGMHPGTFKVFVNLIPVADITQLVP